MGACARACSVVVAALAVVIGLTASGQLALGPLIAEQGYKLTGKQAFVGMIPGQIRKEDREKAFKATDVPSLKGKLALVTGANIGLGFSTARFLAQSGADVVISCRSKTKCAAAADAINSEIGSKRVSWMLADLSSLKSVEAFGKDFAAKHKKLHIFVPNAGIPATAGLELTEDKLESVIQVDHLGHFLMYKLLEPSILRAAEDGLARVSIVSSAAAYSPTKENFPLSEKAINEPVRYKGLDYYGFAKLMNVMFALKVNERLGDKGVANACHPGAVASNIWTVGEAAFRSSLHPLLADHVVIPFLKWSESQLMWTSDDGALTQLALATVVENGGGMYHQIYQQVPLPELATDQAVVDKLWSLSEEMLSKRGF